MFENTKFYYFHPYFSVSTCYGDLHWNRSDLPKTCMRNYSCWFGNLPDYEKGRTQTILCFGSKILTVVGKTRTSSYDVDIVGSFPLFPNYYRTDDRSAKTWLIGSTIWSEIWVLIVRRSRDPTTLAFSIGKFNIAGLAIVIALVPS